MTFMDPIPSVLADPKFKLPQAFGGCNCDCHRIAHFYHMMPCCRPDDKRAALFRNYKENKHPTPTP